MENKKRIANIKFIVLPIERMCVERPFVGKGSNLKKWVELVKPEACFPK